MLFLQRRFFRMMFKGLRIIREFGVMSKKLEVHD